MSKLLIRRLCESHLKAGMVGRDIPLVMGKAPRGKPLPEAYLETSISFGRDFAAEIGGNPRIERAGRFMVAVRTHRDGLEDRNDVVAGWVRGCFAYGADLVRDGIRVNILTTDDSQCVEDGAFLFSPVYVNFMCWSTTNA